MVLGLVKACCWGSGSSRLGGFFDQAKQTAYHHVELFGRELAGFEGLPD